ncbi:MAG: AMP-binding protein, partial [Flavobacteriales bacterium]|nr:AMP-binding protein [Flavobacteriales bacterium]
EDVAELVVNIPADKKNALQDFSYTANADIKLPKSKPGNIVVLTGGTTGDFKSAGRKQSIGDFLNPLVALIDQLQLNHFRIAYIPTPIYHGYGLAALTISILMGSEIHLTRKFNAAEACQLIDKKGIEVITLVPLMLKRMLDEDINAIQKTKRILSGGAPLAPDLTRRTLETLGPILFNLYGTTEAGFCVIGTPDHLGTNPSTIGKTIPGVKMRIHTSSGENGIGELQITSKWIMGNSESKWIPTGDLATLDDDGLIYLKGRTDSMIVSGGENVYPQDLENVLSTHNQIEAVAVIGIPDVEFGKRLKAFVVLQVDSALLEIDLKDWLKGKIARYQMPTKIEFIKELPGTSIGKVNKKELH